MTEEGADLPGYVPTAADLKLRSVLGDYPHQNDGTHLNGGIADDRTWQRRWRLVVAEAMALYRVPSGRVGKRFIQMLTDEWRGVRERKWNAERPLIAAAVILQKKAGVRTAKEIKRRIDLRVSFWLEGRHRGLIDDALAESRTRG